MKLHLLEELWLFVEDKHTAAAVDTQPYHTRRRTTRTRTKMFKRSNANQTFHSTELSIRVARSWKQPAATAK